MMFSKAEWSEMIVAVDNRPTSLKRSRERRPDGFMEI
jgi:hypothetical protein